MYECVGVCSIRHARRHIRTSVEHVQIILPEDCVRVCLSLLPLMSNYTAAHGVNRTRTLFGYYTADEVNYRNTWGRLIFLTCTATAVIYTLTGMIACRKLIFRDARWLLVLLAYFVMGFAHAFITTAILCAAASCVFFTFGQPMGNIEMIVYAALLVVITLFFAFGKKSVLYAL